MFIKNFSIKIILEKIINFLIVILVILLPLVNSHFLNLIGFDFGFYVDGNYEFSKAIFFNILSSLIIILFFLKNIKSRIFIPKITYILSGILILSSVFSDFPITSLFGSNGKGHGIILFFNLIGLSVVFINQEKKELKKYLNFGLYSIIFVLFFGIKEYYFPMFDYGNLSNRAIGTLGHPNFLSLYLILFVPLLLNNVKNELNKKINLINYSILFFIIFTLLLTQSIWGISILFGYFLFLGFSKHNLNKKNIKKYLIILSILLVFIITYIIYNFGVITKLTSFVSRYYIWKTTLIITFSDIKNIIFGLGADTMLYVFDTYKVSELYIFENIGYTADRPHNLGLNILYHFGLLGLSSFVYLIYILYKKIKINKLEQKNMYIFHSIILFLIFTIFNFASVASYLILIIFISIIFTNKQKFSYLFFTPYILFSIISIYGSFIYYTEEINAYSNKIYTGANKYFTKLILENPEKQIFRKYNSLSEICKNLTNKIPSVENYFYCGDLLWRSEKNEALKYYKSGLNKLPDMRNKNSKRYKKYLVNKLFIPERFYSEKFSNLRKILKRD